jgi:arylsulfatase A-like enzyme
MCGGWSRHRRAVTVRNLSLLLLIGTMSALLPGCAKTEPPESARPRAQAAPHADAEGLRAGVRGANLIIILIDAARADHLSFNGYRRRTTPRIDELLGESVVFTEAYAPAPYTEASVASLLTSQFPDTHGAVGVGMPLPSEGVTLSEAMKRQGCVTAAFSANPFFSECFGFARGFDEFHEVFRSSDIGSDQQGSVPPDLMVSAAASWLRAHRDERFFAYLHFLQPHTPYNPPEPFRSMFSRGLSYQRHGVEFLKALYDGNLAYVDQAVGVLLDEIDTLGLGRNSVVVFLSDHGEAFLEHGRREHTTTVYQEMIHVPLAFRLPPGCAVSPRHCPEVLCLTDLMPTLLDLFGIAPPPTMQGRSRLALLAGGSEVEPCFAVVRSRGRDRTGGVARPKEVCYAVTGPRYKLIISDLGGSVELYDREADPRETKNIAAERPRLVAELRAQFEGWAGTQRGRPVVLSGGRVHTSGESLVRADKEVRRRLKALGYLK